MHRDNTHLRFQRASMWGHGIGGGRPAGVVLKRAQRPQLADADMRTLLFSQMYKVVALNTLHPARHRGSSEG